MFDAPTSMGNCLDVYERNHTVDNFFIIYLSVLYNKPEVHFDCRPVCLQENNFQTTYQNLSSQYVFCYLYKKIVIG